MLPRPVGADVVDQRTQKDNYNLQSFDGASAQAGGQGGGFQASLCRSSASSRAWESELVSGAGGVQAQSSSISIYKRGHRLPYSRGLQKSGLMEVTKLLDSESPGKLPDGLALGWLLRCFL